MRRWSMVVLIAALALVSVDGVALAQEEYGPSAASVEVNSSSVACDEPITATGQHWLGDAVVELALDDETVATPTTDGDGTYTATFDVPNGVEPGNHVVRAKGSDGGDELVASTQVTIGACADGNPVVGGIVVERADPSATVGGVSVSGNLPTTGSSSTSLYAGVGVLLLLVGTALTLATLRRRRSRFGA